MKTRVVVALAVWLLAGVGRPQAASALEVRPAADASALAGSILGPGVTIVGTPTFSGSPDGAGFFSGGVASGIGIESGIVLTSGKAADAVGPNLKAAEEYAIGNSGEEDAGNEPLDLPGDAGLEVLCGFETHDAAVLEFDFETAVAGNLAFRYVFASEEYIDYVTSDFNDVFGFSLDGVNIGIVPGSDPPAPITVNSVNPFSFPAFYVNNVGNDIGLGGAVYDVRYDGFTTVITAEFIGLPAGVHHMKLAIADASDGILDSAVFIAGGSFGIAEISAAGPAALETRGLAWSPNPFVVTGYLANKTLAPIAGDALRLDLSGATGLALADGESAEHALPEIPPGETVQTSWNVRALAPGSWQYVVRDALIPDLAAAGTVLVPEILAECAPGVRRACATDLPGACAQGVQVCAAEGRWGGCVAPEPGGEVCDDGADNDCDGRADAADSDCAAPEPTLDCGAAVPGVATIWPPNRKMVSVAIGGVRAADGAPVRIRVDSIAQDEPARDDTFPDGTGLGESAARIRAERLGSGDGRVYVIGFTASSAAGASCQGEVTVCVPHDQSRLACGDDGQRFASTE